MQQPPFWWLFFVCMDDRLAGMARVSLPYQERNSISSESYEKYLRVV